MEILTSAVQKPRQEWLNIAISTKARNKIKQCLNEEKQHLADLGKEELMRRAKNRKIEIVEAQMMKLVKKKGYKFALDFYAEIGDDKLDAGRILNDYQELVSPTQADEKISAEEFQIIRNDEKKNPQSDVMVIGEKSIDGLKYKFARCCAPIYGDDVFGFISSDGMVKIHKTTCPNADHIRQRYPYRVIRASWSGKTGAMLPATLRVVGNDDIGIVANITSIISHEGDTQLRNISIDSHDGMFQGYIVVGVSDNSKLSSLVKKILTVKGVKNVVRV